MKNRILLLLAANLFVCFFLKAETQNIASTISTVTVYPSGATITRLANAKMNKGNQLLRFYGIANSIDQNSIQLEAKGDYIVQSIQYRWDYLEPFNESKAIKILKDSIRILNDKLVEIGGERFAYEQELTFILSNKIIGTQQLSPQSNELENMAAVIRKRLIEIKKALFNISLIERKWTTRSQKIQSRINELNYQAPKPQGIIEVQLIAEEVISGTFKLVYMVGNAGWYPVYDLRFNDLDKGISAKYNASVQQSTGIEWTNVMLVLSTSTPSYNNNKPQLHPWQLYFKNPNAYLYERKANTTYSKLESEDKESVGFLDSVIAEPFKSSADFTAIMESALALDFSIELPYTIPSDGNARIINLRKMDIPSTYSYYAAPKIEQEAFLVANLTEWVNLQLLPGRANIFMGDTYMGVSYLNPGVGSDTISIAFGRDKLVQIDRQLLSRECKKSFLAGKQRHYLSYEITVRNLHKTDISLTIEDQIPISAMAEIEIELGEKSGANFNEKTGKLTWTLAIKAGQTDKKRFAFEVRHPKNKVIYPFNY